jgi:hypothetical protein
MGDCPDPLVGYILGPLTDLPRAIIHIQNLISAPIPLIHINADSRLLAAVKEVDIPIEVSLYSVIRDTCLAMDPCDCTLVANIVYEALGATADTWQEAVRTSRVYALQPKRLKLSLLYWNVCAVELDGARSGSRPSGYRQDRFRISPIMIV